MTKQLNNNNNISYSKLSVQMVALPEVSMNYIMAGGIRTSKDREAWHAALYRVAKVQILLRN